MKRLVILVILLFALGACGGGEAPLEERIIGTWEGAMTNTNGDKIPATWQFLEGGTMLVDAGGLVSYGATWEVEGNRINIVTELAPDDPTYRDAEFVSDDVVKLTKEDITETWSRVDE